MGMGKSINKKNENNQEDFFTDSFIKLNNNETIFNLSTFSFFPNPTNSDFSISYTIDEDSFVKIELYDILGNKVKTLLNIQKQLTGNYYSNFSMFELSSGTYFLVFSQKSKTITGKIIKK